MKNRLGLIGISYLLFLAAPVHADTVQDHFNAYLQALRAPAALEAINSVTGLNLPAAGDLTPYQTQTLYSLLYNADGSYSKAYTQPTQAAQDFISENGYLQTLRKTPNALTSWQTITGVGIPTEGPINTIQSGLILQQLYDGSGKQTAAYLQPEQSVNAITQGGIYLQALRSTTGALPALQNLTGQTLPASGALTGPQIGFLFTQLFNSDGSKTPAYNQPAQTAQSLVQAGAYLDALRSSPGALTALQTISGQNIPASGRLTGDQIGFLYSQLYDAKGNKTTAYSQPTEAAQSIVQAGAYLQALRSMPGGLTALQSITGQSLPANGALDPGQFGFLMSQMFDSNGNRSAAAMKPSEAVHTLTQAAAYLDALRTTPGALNALQDLTGQSVPPSGPLTTKQADVLYSQLFDKDGNTTSAYDFPKQAAQTATQADAYLQALRGTSGALAAMKNLTGQDLPGTGALSPDQVGFLIGQLFDQKGNKTSAYTQPSEAAQTLTQASAYLQALRQTPGALAALQGLTGQALPTEGTLTVEQIQYLAGAFYDVNGNKSAAYSQPVDAAQSLTQAAAYLQALRSSPGALDALHNLTGENVAASGTVTPDQLGFLFSQLFDANGNPTSTYNQPTQSAKALTQASAYLQTLRQTPGALQALQELSGQALPDAGMLSSGQLQFLYTQLFDTNGQPTTAYNQPSAAVQTLLSAGNYLDALRQTPGALAALADLTGQTLPTNGALLATQAEYLFGQMFTRDGSPAPASIDPRKAADALAHADAYLQALRASPEALNELAKETGIALPASGPLDPDQVKFLISLLYDSSGNPVGAYNDPNGSAQALTDKAKGGWNPVFTALLSGLAVGLALGLSRVASLPQAIFGGAATAGLMVAILGTGKSNSSSTVAPSAVSTPASSPQAFASGSTFGAPIPPLATPTADPAAGLPQSASQITVLDPAAKVVSSLSPNQAYQPLYRRDSSGRIVDDPEGTKALYAQGRWLATAGNPAISEQAARAALEYASSANKKVSIITNPTPSADR